MRALDLLSPPKVVHVVGTNGKGSVAAMIAAAYAAEGVRVGRFLSPHVEEFRERIQVGEAPISEAEVARFVGALPPLDPPPAFFELTLAMALDHFARTEVEVAVFEAGVGARHDATVVLENVRSVVLTNVGRDHLDTLGPTLTDVARDKAEAIRPGVPILTAATGGAVRVLAEVASTRRSPLFLDLPSSRLFALPDGLEAASPTRTQNRRLAAATLRLAGVSEAAIRHGLRATLPARAEVFRVGGREVLLDGAHNPSAAEALLGSLHTPFVLVFGALGRKQGEATLRVLEPHALQTFVTQVKGEASTLSREGRCLVLDPIEAVRQAVAACPEGGRVVITGSLYLAGQVRPFLRRQREAS